MSYSICYTLDNPAANGGRPGRGAYAMDVIATLPDTPRFKNRIDVRSDHSGRVYRVSYDNAPGAGYWSCSCMGCVTHGTCRHLEEIGVSGRKDTAYQMRLL